MSTAGAVVADEGRVQDLELFELDALEAARRLREGSLTSEELVGACLARIDELEDNVQAWAYLDRDYALEQARAADEARQSGKDVGPLHGLPVGVKDIFDTRDMPTENGTPVHAGRKPTEDATVVSLLRQAGAVIMGKTVTTEVAFYHPGKTRNPHDISRTPGGSSSGSAAAVAAGMVPLAVGTQTNGSVIRPAAFCGVYGYKPSHGLISRHGVLAQSHWLDTVGVFARSVGDAAFLAEPLMAFDDRDPDMAPRGWPRLAETAAQEPPLTPTLAFVRTPVWDQAEEDTEEAFVGLAEVLGEACDEADLPEPFDSAIALHRTVMAADFAKSFAALYERGRDQLSETLRGMIEEGQTVLAVDYNRAVEWREVLNAGLDQVFERYDAILTPSAPGEAPIGLDATGNPAFCSLWTYCGTPAVSLPLMGGANGLPIGVQLVGRRGDDARLLRTAQWLAGQVARAADD
jgi:Asp-tRNA(Asn)/Glu-tRNA(Gln) amidotransferase A subunit family amidase